MKLASLLRSWLRPARRQDLDLRALLDTLPVGVVLQDLDGRVLECNVMAAELLGLSSVDELLGAPSLARAGMSVRDDLSPYPASEVPSVRTLRTGQGLRGASVGLIMPDGRLRWVLTNTEPVRDASGRMTGVISSAMEVTQQREQQQLLSLAIESASLGLWHWDLRTDEVEASERIYALLGYDIGEQPALTSALLFTLFHPDDRSSVEEAIRMLLHDGRQPMSRQIRLRHRDGHWVWTLFSGTVAARDTQGRVLRMAGICLDIHAQKELEEALRRSARTDSLTRLPNRAELLQRIQFCIDRSRRDPTYGFAVLFMDFDRFKQVNDTLGHSVGDELLRQIAGRLEHSLRPGDAFVRAGEQGQMAARIGGDEFVVLLDHIRDDLDVQLVAGRLLEALSRPYEIGPHRVSSTTSIGIVTTRHMASDPDSVLRDADIAMYEAKRQGRARYEMFDPSMRKRVHDDVELENDLRQALEKGELQVVYQPLIDLRTGRLAGMEALARWHHPRRGVVSPLVFIPVAEASGLINRIGEFVLGQACRELVRLREQLGERAPAAVSVNVSRAQLRQGGFASRLSDLFRACSLPPRSLMLEVTESLAAQDESVQAVLREVRELGASLALDDFGTGYSSLSCLHELPVNQVKIDRSFVSQAPASNYHRVMIEATIRMAQALDLQTVAEGIETPEQAELMLRLGCDKVQGFLYSAPMAAREFEQWARKQTAAAPH